MNQQDMAIMPPNRINKYFEEPVATGSNRLLNDSQGRESRVAVRRAVSVVGGTTPEKAVQFLRQRGIPAKVFCVHRAKKQHFAVKSRDYDWEVVPLKSSKTKVPAELLARVQLLLEHGVSVQRLYVGNPMRESASDALFDEASVQARVLSEEVARAVVAVLEGTDYAEQLINEARNQSRNPLVMVTGRYMPDPVLLVKIRRHSELIEVARWI